eukprot:Blabericola_migrator_1__9036@NODE_480_length_8144_cov_370_014362_g305_i1_p3_GENE_NODE_480_length_8144_cov_370_014362_g305_i1NODE_480_length_8144_cov_370_014362_g305_i1_p3_ORF_typecomplete_len313_score39_24Myb_DNAbinding/PF00249_31/3_4e07Myb_DNAbind_6/PF13921_6/1e04Myb_DNAbind_6/PF13921_6/0_0031_NODE_480_length_8144_cov_370_014362_g305_i132934231
MADQQPSNDEAQHQYSFTSSDRSSYFTGPNQYTTTYLPTQLDIHLDHFLAHCNFIVAILDNPEITASKSNDDDFCKRTQELRAVLQYCVVLLQQRHFGALMRSPAISDKPAYDANPNEPSLHKDPSPVVSCSDLGLAESAAPQHVKLEEVRQASDADDTLSGDELVSIRQGESLDAIGKSRKRKRLLDMTPEERRVSWDSQSHDNWSPNCDARRGRSDGFIQTRPRSPEPGHSRCRRLWTPEEIRIFMSLLTKHGRGSWTQMVKTGLLQRDNVQLKDKWRSLVSRGKLGYSKSRGYFEFDPARDLPKHRVRE